MSEFDAARQNMVESQVMTSGVTDPRVLDAMAEIPRERFVPENKRSLAYLGDDLRVKDAADGRAARYLMDPRALGKLVELAEVKPSDLVLDIGPATGYSTALLAKLSDTVVAVEEDPALVEQASAELQSLGVDNAAVIEGALTEGSSKQGPFDVIFVNGAVSAVPEALLKQLKDGGRLVTVVQVSSTGKARIYTVNHGKVGYRDAFDAGIHVLPGFEAAETFTF
ncbi:MAG: protein-L-isoaspartate O-methyltransferase [Parvibaculaceae bacterium]